MNEVYYLLIGLWVMGWVMEVAHTDATISKAGLDYPYKGAWFVITAIMFFTWPYWYFYGRPN